MLFDGDPGLLVHYDVHALDFDPKNPAYGY